MSPEWIERQKPPRLERRLAFEDYEGTRHFLEQAAELSEHSGIHPDISFGRTYVNITLHAEEGAQALSQAQRDFARALDTLAPTQEDA
ncbi:4a-hydroxytetrahydrobiopterin dehydratase [Ectothiorhodospira marina]|uniref:4a-hydroxytetrahydrobiopterin dehydratase n=1 Tax=Ectothiorhodospira marina TaxID=1396821 RepID=A0A1H7P511_9GAMM|nr:4a-hydroxytetrahydrobiopterin dehydratase [Ectothiorhodospira marina]SEL30355.1 Pterin-4a-carbinolamine dehydratase [Ectothiorhodospira marina]